MNGTAHETVVLSAGDVTRCLEPGPCREAVERAFAELGSGRTPAPRMLAFESESGSFHIKAACFGDAEPRFVAKVNGNFPTNPERRALPTIQGVLVLADAADGRLLALMDSGAITAIRTAAATAVAARALAPPGDGALAIVGCGLQGVAHVDALLALRSFPEVRLYDRDPARARRLADRGSGRAGTRFRVASSAREAAAGAAVVVTATTGAAFVLGAGDVEPGALVAGVGADNPHKRELHPDLLGSARVVVDDIDQCAAGGDLHHAIAAGAMRAGDVHADLGSIIAGRRPGRERPGDLFVFDSTGIAIEDAAAAMLAYRRAGETGTGLRVALGADPAP